jgi:XTP/dITP diphosphohydrolase
MNIWFATGNTHKKEELSAILGGENGPRLLIPADAGLDFDPLGTGHSFHANALLKAMALYSLLKNGFSQNVWQEGDAIIADDSGLCVDSLGGRPGIFSARYAGKAGENSGNAGLPYAGENFGVTKKGKKKLESAQRNALLLEELGDTAGRSARFVCAMVLFFSPDRYFLAQETLEGEIVKGLEFARGAGGFGYDPILYLPEIGKTAAELSEEEKNKISHRGKAAKLIAGILGKK